MGETRNENPKCYLHIPQLKKDIYVLNIIIQSIMGKKKCEGKGPQRNIQNLSTPNRDIETQWRRKP